MYFFTYTEIYFRYSGHWEVREGPFGILGEAADDAGRALSGMLSCSMKLGSETCDIGKKHHYICTMSLRCVEGLAYCLCSCGILGGAVAPAGNHWRTDWAAAARGADLTPAAAQSYILLDYQVTIVISH
jgi:hypothetical protein